MGHDDHLELEGPDGELAAERDLGDRHGVEQPGVAQLALQHRGGERRGIDRRAQARPQVGDGAEMVLVRMGDDDAGEIGLALLDEGRIGHHHLDSGHGVVAEGDAEIDHQPFSGMAVEVEVHADLARAAQRHEQQLVGRRDGHCVFLLRLKISISPRAVMSGTVCSMMPIEPSNTGARPPVETTFIGLPNSLTMRVTMPSIKPT